MSSVIKCENIVLVLTITFSITPFGILAQERENMITRIINQTRIHCVSDLFNEAMFTFPPLKKVQDAVNLLVVGKWDNDDWVLKDSRSIISNVEDKRWEDFDMNQMNYLRFDKLETSVSFSVSGTDKIEFFADDGESLDYFTQPINNTQEWTTFTIFFKDNNVYYFINNIYIRRHLLKPTQLVAKTVEKAHFKIHEYKYKEANEVTNAKNNPTTLTIPPSEKSFLILYISLCKSCVLEVEYDGRRQNITSNIKESNVLEEWQAHKIKLNSSKANKVNLIRKTNDPTEDGYWKLDARLYNNENNTVTYDILPDDKSVEMYYCKYLKPPNTIQKRTKRSANPKEDFPRIIPVCPAGKVGSKCDISCENVLGREYSECQKHKICNSTTCECAWGYHGPNCDKECADGLWGFDCQHKCEECDMCNKQTGKCVNKQSTIEDNGIVRIINETHIYCVSGLSNFAMFTSPLLEKVQDAQNLSDDVKWQNDDWVTENSSIIISNVQDKRWEDFTLTKTKYLHFALPKPSVSFSVYGTDRVEFLADDGESLDYFQQPIELNHEWTTFTIIFKDHHIYYFMNKNFIRKYWLEPSQLVVRTAQEAYLKIHKYVYKAATEATNTKTGPTSLTIPRSDKAFLTLYISLCKSCVLEVEYGGQVENISSNIKEVGIFEQWQTHNIALNSNTSKVNFNRKKNDETEDGYWKLDVRLYNYENNTVAYKISNTSENKPEEIHCKYLRPQSNSKQHRAKRSVDPTEYSTDLTNECPSGKVGPKCDISCENVLGHQYSRCQEHKICNSIKCQCPIGYNGEWCDKCEKDTSKSWIVWCTLGLLATISSVGILEAWRRRRKSLYSKVFTQD